uniref:Uncharacterized protein n=1 Tax=Lactuca sativa TaxID=4236 RepID=A0A9R1W3R3_LACSA|nr:hypothetical protein LSAT_V11C300105160 [Lactuca sativa]
MRHKILNLSRVVKNNGPALAKAIATKIVEGDYMKQDYVLELQATNVDTTIKIDVYIEHNPSNLTRKFKRIYIGLGPLKNVLRLTPWIFSLD